MSRHYGLLAADRFDHTRREWGVLELDGRRYLVNDTFNEAVPAHGRPPGEYVWAPQRHYRDRPRGKARAKTLATLLRRRLRDMAKAA